jgi:hypothetical protein
MYKKEKGGEKMNACVCCDRFSTEMVCEECQREIFQQDTIKEILREEWEEIEANLFYCIDIE